MTNSRRKGAEYEREIAAELRAAGLSARRGQQYSGANGDPDVVVEDLPGYHLELKRRANRISVQDLHRFLAQADDDRNEEEIPVIIHRIDREESLVTMRLSDWIQVVTRPSSVQPGRWIEPGDDYYTCPICGAVWEAEYDRCPGCGAEKATDRVDERGGKDE